MVNPVAFPICIHDINGFEWTDAYCNVAENDAQHAQQDRPLNVNLCSQILTIFNDRVLEWAGGQNHHNIFDHFITLLNVGDNDILADGNIIRLQDLFLVKSFNAFPQKRVFCEQKIKQFSRIEARAKRYLTELKRYDAPECKQLYESVRTIHLKTAVIPKLYAIKVKFWNPKINSGNCGKRTLKLARTLFIKAPIKSGIKMFPTNGMSGNYALLIPLALPTAPVVFKIAIAVLIKNFCSNYIPAVMEDFE